MHISILTFLAKHNWKHATKDKPVSEDYRHTRYIALTRMLLIELPSEGFEPTRLEKLRRKHIVALAQRWEREGRSAQTIQNRLSMLGWVCDTLRKAGCVPKKNRAQLLKNPARYRTVSVAREEKTLEAKKIDPVEVIGRIADKSPRVALIQLLKAAFGLRTKEAIRLRPHEADQGDHLFVTLGTKGGRPRVISYFDFEGDLDPEELEVVLWNLRENQFRVRVIELAKYLVPPGHSMIPAGYTLKQYRRHERHITAKYGRMTKRLLGVTPHGFRHAFLSARAAGVSELLHPLRRTFELTREQVVRDRIGRQVAAIDAGHHDPRTTATYYGAHTERSPRGLVREVAACMKGPVDEPLIRRGVDGRLVGGRGRRIRVLERPPKGRG